MTPLAFAPWQGLLDGMGWVLARIYDVIPNFGLSIIVLTIIIRVILLPLGIKQIKSMQHMQAIQPKIKALQKKYKNDKQKQQEETMKLYKEAGVNPLGGCLPLLLQFPILIAMYSILRLSAPNAEYVSPTETPDVPEVVNNHYPTDSALYADVTNHDAEATTFLFMNLQCSLVQAGTQVTVPDSQGNPTEETINCGGSKVVATIPYAMLLVFMVGTTFFQQRQMTKASPPGAQSAQQQAIMKFMPLMFAFFGLSFPAGLVLYWSTSNVFQIGQQAFLMRAGHIGPDALERRIAEQKARAESTEPKKGFMAKMMEKAESAQQVQKTQDRGRTGDGSGASKRTAKPTGGPRPSGGGQRSSKKSSGKGGSSRKGDGPSKGSPRKGDTTGAGGDAGGTDG
jgi:YidC/Oxa1 family membrane protein insertase